MKQLFRFLGAVVITLLMAACGDKASTVDYAEGLNDIPDLTGKKVAVLAGSLQELATDELSDNKQVLRLASLSELLASLSSSQADYVLIDTTALVGLDMQEKGFKVVFGSHLLQGDLGFGFSKDNPALHDEFNAFLTRCRADGLLDSITQLWTKGDVKNVVMQHPQLNPDGEVLRVGTMSFFPFSFVQNGRYSGLEMELVEAFAAETGRKVEYVTIDFGGLIAALESNKIDMISGSMTITEERAKKVLFSDTYFYASTVCICRSGEQSAASKPFFATVKESFYNNLIQEDRWKIVVDGLWETVVISIFSILLGTLFGGFICWMRLSRRKVLDGIAKVYVEIIRGVPILVLLMLMFYVIFAQSAISPRWVAIIAFAMNFGAYVSEMFRTGIEGVDRGQTEAGLAMGFTPFKTFVYFIVPQAAKRVIPVFKGEAVSLFKNTSVVGFIAIQDLTKASEIIRARTFDAFFPLIVISILYFILAWLMGKLLDILAKKIA